MEIEYKKFVARIWYSADVGGFYGEVINSEIFIAFQANTLQTCREAMQEAVDDYLLGG